MPRSCSSARWRDAAALAALVATACGCGIPHVSMAVARGPTHVTYVRRDPDTLLGPDYLVDCLQGSDGRAAVCETVPLEKRRAR